ncbi:outer membrane lipoprotein-sorting protein [candidate division KSB1 bacterium]|nr:outer membrane lipoprotein-sorting protein [candidate division KSB1 bacterium]
MYKLLSIIITIILFAGITNGQDLSADDIINRVNDLMNQQSSKAVMTMTITTSSGQKRTFEYLTYSKDRGEKNLMIYLAPNRVKGQKMLMLNNADDIWAYFVRTKRVRKLATHAKKQKLEGSDFSYEDMGGSNSFITDFNAKKTGTESKKGHECYKLELSKKPGSGSAYSKLVMWVIKENFVPVYIDYYNEDNPDRVEKSLVQKEIKEIDGIPTGTKIIMTSKNDNTNTVMEIKKIEYNIPIADELFTERGLRK